ncbi:hypothetical protein QEJ31_07000 [Pigmentibacter sp. JX0631]|uniref:hypothetical protein n=1 Tax=Pigmentibacter sp. JX0631 TaxID=2976982 RepID=UPI002469B54D|nr:hypothetical protein [Pigmentibacter sp. JX0631]WGL61340.1 hypothetical protein QEJ31_07000 [Pigmentibacter sp. JX0631]
MKLLNKFVLFKLSLVFCCANAQNVYQINILESREPVTFTIDSYNTISFISFPKYLNGNLNFSNVSLGNFYPGGVNVSNCATVESRARNAVNQMFPESMRIEQKNMVRKNGTVLINLNSGVSFALSNFRRKVLDKAAEVMHTDISKFDLDNSFQIDKVTYTIDYDKNSITNIIDSKDEIKPQTDKFLNQLFFNNGYTSTEISASDLICDLYSGKAKIKMIFSGKYGKQTTTTYLLERSEIEAVYQNMLLHSNDYYDLSAYNSKNKNLVLSGMYLKESLDKINKFDLDKKIFLSIYEQIVSQESGKVILNIDNQTLYKKMEVQDNKPYTYLGNVTFDYKP